MDVMSPGLVRIGITGIGGVMSKTTTSFLSVEEEISGTCTGLCNGTQLLLVAVWCQGILCIDAGALVLELDVEALEASVNHEFFSQQA